jgi:hypothetical protein
VALAPAVMTIIGATFQSRCTKKAAGATVGGPELARD